MAKKGTTKSTTTEVRKCELCGKILKAHETHGALCPSRIAKGQVGEVLRKHYASISAPEAPAGYRKLAELDRYIKAHPESGCTISKMVKAIGRDRALEPAAHPIAAPVYVGRVRYIRDFLFTSAGLKCIATGDWSKAPAPGIKPTKPTRKPVRKATPKPAPEPVAELVTETAPTAVIEIAIVDAE